MNELLELLDRFQALPAEKQQEITKEAMRATGHMRWVPNPGPQTAAFECEADELFFGGSAGSSKGLLPDCPVMTPFGFRKISDLKVGDSVCSVDGGRSAVIGVYPQPRQPVYRVSFADGGSIVTDGPHRWLYAIARKGKWAKSGLTQKIGTTEQLRSLIERGHRPLIPLPKPLRFTRSYRYSMREIDPYLLGVLLGDGSIRKNVVRITTADPAVIDGCDIPECDLRQDSEIEYRVIGESRKTIKKELVRLGIDGCLAHEKSIPEAYLWATVEDRWRLLQGLMDTDGCAGAKKSCGISFTSVSRKLADGVQFLVRSLGGYATLTQRKSFLNGTRHRDNYAVYIRLPEPERAFSLERKKAKCARPQTVTRRIVSIEPEGESETVCIAVDHPSSLYIAGEDVVVTHNTDLVIGLSLTEHHRSLILRRTNKEASKLFERYHEIIGSRDGWNGHDSIWRVDGRVIDIGGCQLEADKQKYKGHPHDLIGFDEISDFTESQYVFITTWNRSANPKQRCRVVGAGNPPTTPEGLWVIQYWAPWLDPRHPNPALPGELRWFVGGEEVEGPGMYEIDGRPAPARSRTFIPGKLEDNPDLSGTNYDAVLASLPEELRLAYREGRFDVGLKDNPYQIVPTAWIRAAQDRWQPEPPRGIPMCAIGVDIAQGGNDNTCLSIRHDGWFARNIKVPGKDTPDGSSVAALVVAHRRDQADIVLDMGGGYGGAAYERLLENGIKAKKHVGAKESLARTEDQTLRFSNRRTEVYWRFREALNPDQFGGSTIALPDDPALVADLTAVTWTLAPGGTIKAISKEKLVKDLGRSPDDGDAVVLSWSSGPRAMTHINEWRPDSRVGKMGAKRLPQVNMGGRTRRG